MIRAILLASALAGCGVSVYTSTINSPPHPLAPRDPSTVEVYTGGPPPRARVDITMFTAALNGAHSDPFGDELASLRQQAAQMGCDALLVQRTSGRDMVATCTIYVDGGPMPRAQPQPQAAPPPPAGAPGAPPPQGSRELEPYPVGQAR
nr:hypothetical protein [Kofleriaceae bacterium]